MIAEALDLEQFGDRQNENIEAETKILGNTNIVAHNKGGVSKGESANIILNS